VIYVSDTEANTIFRIDGSGASVWLNSGLEGPNGLFVNGTNLSFVEFGSGKLYNANMDSKALELVSSGFSEGDGLIRTGDGQWLISSFNGSVNYLNNTAKTVVLDTKANETNAADIGYVTSEKLVLVPTFFKNTVAAYTLEN
jgi:hypothetical protein